MATLGSFRQFIIEDTGWRAKPTCLIGFEGWVRYITFAMNPVPTAMMKEVMDWVTRDGCPGKLGITAILDDVGRWKFFTALERG